MGDGTLDATVFYRYTVADPSKVQLAQFSNYIYPYSVVNGTTGDRDELIYREGEYIKILKNNNNNTFSSWISIDTDFEFPDAGDMKIADVNNDGFNDIIVCLNNSGVKVYVNNAGASFSLGYENLSVFSNVWSISMGDFNKDGFSDLVTVGDDEISIYLNTGDEELYEEEETSSIYFQNNYKNTVEKSTIADLYNKGGLAVLFSGEPDNLLFSQTKEILRANATDTDAVPAPTMLFKANEIISPVPIFSPKLMMYNRGDRDFLQFKIYKKRSNYDYDYVLFDSTANDTYIDTTELIYSPDCCNEPPTQLCSYYVKTEDNSKQLSINSDTIDYETYDYGDSRPSNEVAEEFNNNIPKEFTINQNYPNPFNPSTKIKYELPMDGNVSIKIYDITGRVIMNLLNENKSAGRYEVTFDGGNFASGIYYYKIESGNFSQVRKMILIK